MGDSAGQVTQMLAAIAEGDRRSVDRLFPLIYDELRGLARSRMARERTAHTLVPTALVHEAYLRLVGSDQDDWASRRYFFAAAGEAMRRILVEHARSRNRLKRGGERERTPLDDSDLAEPAASIDWPALDEAVQALEKEDARLAEVVNLRFFAGLDVEETAQALGISARTVKRDWRYAKAVLHEHLSGDRPDRPAEKRDEPR